MAENAGKYPHREIEAKWQERWERESPWQAKDTGEKTYLLIEFPYPSGDGLHVGHIRSWTALDIVARKRRMQGENVLYPIGWDAFGLPAENYAIKTGVHPAITTKQNTDNFRRQIKSLGLSFDWSREINTTDPGYYKWTQWIFTELYKKGLAYKTKTLINWCPKDKVTLANEEVIDGACERCGTPVEKREKEQWMLAITKYAQRLYDDLDSVDYITPAKIGQRNWIGPSEGARIKFPLSGQNAQIEVFTTRPDTIFGATYMVLAPEHPEIARLKGQISNWQEVGGYIAAAKSKSDIERSAEGKEKTGVELKGIAAVNPATKEEIPVYIADYVLASYGTGAIMAVPAHDERDHEFAKKYGIEVRQVVEPNIIDRRNPPVPGKQIVERNNVHAIVRDPETGAYLALKWKKFNWTTFPMGGREDGEDPVEAARREVQEETGFSDLKLVRTLPYSVRAEYFAAHKDQNRISHTHAVVFDLASRAQTEVSEEEKGNHEVIWLDAPSLTYEHMTHAEVEEWQAQLRGTEVYTGPGILASSGQFTGMDSEEAKKKLTEFVGGEWVTTYKLRDWVFGRQRYWGEPIPMVNCPDCGWQPVKESELPVRLPEVDTFLPGTEGESPLANMEEWVRTTCPKCSGPARRETDVMPQWAGSSWYYLRYVDAHNDKEFAQQGKLKYWTPVDWYNGGMEHTTLHLLYSRFWHKFLFDIGAVPTNEPYAKRTSHGLILAEDGRKMSKSWGNVVSPDELVERYGADALRLYEMFIGPFDQSVAWSTAALSGTRRFIERVWRLEPKDEPAPEVLETLLNQTVKKVGEDIEALKMNTAVSSLMILLNELEKGPALPAYRTFLQLLSPFAPHVAHELAERHGIGLSQWPSFDEGRLASSTATIAVQVNGKVRGSIDAASSASESDVLAAAHANPVIEKWLAGKEPTRIVYVPGKILSISVAQ